MWSTLFPDLCLGCQRLLRGPAATLLCTRCRVEQQPLPARQRSRAGIHSMWPHEGPLREAVLALKFTGALALAGPLGQLLASDPRLFTLSDGDPVELVVPIPLHWRRRLVRGFDQSEQLARWALRHARARAGHDARPPLAKLETRALRRIRHTPAQTTLDAPAREHNVAGAFAVPRPERVADHRVLLIDDVTTTGATARACVEVLRAAGATKVETLTLLRAL